MFYPNQQNINKEKYQQFLSIVGSLSNLFSDSNVPYLYYRIAEKIFCRAFNAEDLSRSDVSATLQNAGELKRYVEKLPNKQEDEQ